MKTVPITEVISDFEMINAYLRRSRSDRRIADQREVVDGFLAKYRGLRDEAPKKPKRTFLSLLRLMV